MRLALMRLAVLCLALMCQAGLCLGKDHVACLSAQISQTFFYFFQGLNLFVE